MRILVAAHYASERLGGEALIPLRIARHLTDLGHEVCLVTHESARPELQSMPAFAGRVHYAKSLPGFGWLLPVGERLPDPFRQLAWSVTQVERQLGMASLVRRLVAKYNIDVVHQPISVSPSVPSALRRLGAPLVVGPLNGGMELPPGFRSRESVVSRVRKSVRRPLGLALSFILRGDREAAVVLAANERTIANLPKSLHARVRIVSDTGVDENQVVASDASEKPTADRRRLKLVFVGRLVALKAVDLLLEACVEVQRSPDVVIELAIVGDGPCRRALEDQATAAGLTHVRFSGWLSRQDVDRVLQQSDALVLPSLQEAGGAVVLEGMGAGLPVVVADWGGPSYLVDETCGIAVAPSDHAGLVTGLAHAISFLATHPAERRRMGQAGRARVHQQFRWRAIAEQLVEAYVDAVDQYVRR